VRQTGSGNIGATNVARTGSKGLAVATLILDAAKGYLAVWLAFHSRGAIVPYFSPAPIGMAADMSSALEALQYAYSGAALAALFAILGHMFPVWLRFKGGKGVATALGAFLALAPTAVLICLAIFVAAFAVTRYVSLGSILAAIVFPFAAWWVSPYVRTTVTMVLIVASSLLIVIRHKDNIRRLLAGNENRFGGGKSGAA
jgi:glycerol-3-phosphate acyltransferase PlsY